ncbi:hypothetical protein E2562_004241 [Oryza meyeriana var. granulata]|uniref:PRP1 splicing factor N-terminal domain-containing protein n=1 Tax=Oryza meyeriana var. granulata TaxID=110450 RepID=A0A6G1BRP3_9ORYZ|nr:hypothetical protein E2562_004241 [Oryza meyeriana var. granulata]
MVFLPAPDGWTHHVDLNPPPPRSPTLPPPPPVSVVVASRCNSSSGSTSPTAEPSPLLASLGVSATSLLLVHLPLLGGMTGLTPATPPPPLPPAHPARCDFLNSKPPRNYVAGLGRGAIGFTTRWDIGPARAAPDLPDQSAATPVIGCGRGKPHGDNDGGDEEKGYDQNQKFDKFEGNDTGLFSNTDYDDNREVDAN